MIASSQTFTGFGREEHALLCGTGRFVDDLHAGGEARSRVLRSPHAHARIRGIDHEQARRVPGVLAILTAADLPRDIQPLPCMMPLSSFDGTPRAGADRVILAADRVRHVGDGVAFIVAETDRAAAEAASLVQVDYDVLPAVVAPGNRAVSIWPDAPNNVCFDWRFGDAPACEQQFAQAAHVTRMTLRNPRILPSPIEPRAALGFYDRTDDSFTLVSNTQGVHFVRRVLAEAFRIAPERLRVVTPNVGGGFGTKIFAYPEQALVLVAARLLGRPVRWTATRTEAFQSDTQARDHSTEAALALDADGRFLALEVRIEANLGAYLSQYAPLTATGVGAPVQGGAYRFPALAIRVRGAFTNTVPVDAYRGAGRPEATYVLERIIDRAARELGLDPADLRARNLPDAQSDSLVAVTGLSIDGGQFLDNQRKCLDAADRAGLLIRRTESVGRGKLRGFGFANYLEANGGLAVAHVIEADKLPIESLRLSFAADGSLDMVVGTQSTGQDHARPLIQHAAKAFGLPPDAITLRQGDTDLLSRGGGTGGSKSLLTASVALEQAIADVISRGKARLAQAWTAAAADIVFDRGVFALRGSNRATSLQEIAAAYPGALDGESHGLLTHGSCANGCHACEVEIDPETGIIEVVRYTAVDDFGAVVNEAAVRGQVQGGVAQGLGQALSECAIYDPTTGNLITGALTDYALPRARDVPEVHWIDNGLRSRTNLFGAKACGEAGASAAPPAVMNAIADALSAYPAAQSLQMPARPEDVWRVINAAC